MKIGGSHFHFRWGPWCEKIEHLTGNQLEKKPRDTGFIWKGFYPHKGKASNYKEREVEWTGRDWNLTHGGSYIQLGDLSGGRGIPGVREL